MGQVWGNLQSKFDAKQVREKQLRKITDRVFDHFAKKSGKDSLSLEDLYIAVLLVFNDINKHLPGPHHDPPSKEEVESMMQHVDRNLDGELNKEEFAQFVKKFTSDVVSRISQGFVITVIAAPVVALMTKRATEGVPRIGPVVQKIPNTVYASAITAAVLIIEKVSENRA
eukprot:TRINITY_DN481_c0_g1_i2.p1 TRINITY_DN481_c0_g1~~TRINITY_DN481_c0_g1_i2.p1  ORF type:complete len:170 (-),score=47.79 TRINITY_DN481_c0_g1_i2:305-814(-)